jgi:hypothetical protein
VHTIDEWQSTFDNATKNDFQLPKVDLINSIPVFSKFADRIPSIDEFDQQIIDETLKYAKFFQANKVHLILTDSHSSDDL